jgi:hypothetical protein
VLVIGLTPAARTGPDPPGFTLLDKNSDDRSFECVGSSPIAAGARRPATPRWVRADGTVVAMTTADLGYSRLNPDFPITDTKATPAQPVKSMRVVDFLRSGSGRWQFRFHATRVACCCTPLA